MAAHPYAWVRNLDEVGTPITRRIAAYDRLGEEIADHYRQIAELNRDRAAVGRALEAAVAELWTAEEVDQAKARTPAPFLAPKQPRDP